MAPRAGRDQRMMAAPMPLGPFLVEDGGRLTFRTKETQPSFSFQWRNRRFAVRLHDQRLHFAAPIGRIPSTSAGVGRRDGALALLAALRRALPQGWTMQLLPDHRLQLETEQIMEWPATVAALLTPIIALVLRAAPVLDLIEENRLA